MSVDAHRHWRTRAGYWTTRNKHVMPSRCIVTFTSCLCLGFSAPGAECVGDWSLAFLLWYVCACVPFMTRLMSAISRRRAAVSGLKSANCMKKVVSLGRVKIRCLKTCTLCAPGAVLPPHADVKKIGSVCSAMPRCVWNRVHCVVLCSAARVHKGLRLYAEHDTTNSANQMRSGPHAVSRMLAPLSAQFYCLYTFLNAV